MITEKFCWKCGKDKPIDEFKIDRRNTNDGRSGSCKSCSKPTSEQNRKYNLAKIGLTIEEYNAMVVYYDNCCAICRCTIAQMGRQRGSNENWIIDHDHKTGGLRGLLCNRCNLVLGHMDDDPFLFLAAAEYLRKFIAAVKPI